MISLLHNDVTISPVYGSNKRRAQRHYVAMSGTLRPTGHSKIPIVLRDLSATGFRCEYIFELRMGEHMWLKIDQLEGLEAVVVRRDGYCYGFEFLRPLHPAVLENIVRIRNSW